MYLKSLLFIGLLGASLYSEAADAWTKKTNFAGVGRHRTTSFSIGNKGYSGLGHHNSGPLGNVLFEDFWEYDPATDAWTQIANFGGGKRYHARAFSYGTKGYVLCGRAYVDTVYFKDVWEYSPISNSWTEKAELPGEPRIGAMAFTFNIYGVITGGIVESGGIGTDVWAYHFDTDVWYSAPPFTGPPRISAAAFVIGSSAYLTTGYSYGSSLNDTWRLDSATWAWTEVGNPVSDSLRGQAHGFSIDGYGYVLTGNDWSLGEDYGDMWRYDPETEIWSKIADFPGAKRRYMDGFEIGDKAYMGLGTNGNNLTDFWEYDPSKTAGDNPNELIEIEVYPNPASDKIQILSGLKEGDEYRLEICTISGRTVYSEVHHSSNPKLDVGQFENGVYIISLFYQSQRKFGRQLIIQ